LALLMFRGFFAIDKSHFSATNNIAMFAQDPQRTSHLHFYKKNNFCQAQGFVFWPNASTRQSIWQFYKGAHKYTPLSLFYF